MTAAVEVEGKLPHCLECHVLKTAYCESLAVLVVGAPSWVRPLILHAWRKPPSAAAPAIASTASKLNTDAIILKNNKPAYCHIQ